MEGCVLPDDRITEFLQKHHVLTLATSVGKEPYCANLFYAWGRERGMFVFTSASDTRHATEAALNPVVAGSVVLETPTVGMVRGVQFQGKMFRPEGEIREYARKRYLKRFPYAAAMELDLWAVEPFYIKMTDNRLGFGKKIIWKKESDISKP